MDFHLLGWGILIFYLLFLYGFVPLWLVEFVFSNVFVLDLRACQYFGFVGLGCFSAVLIFSPLLLTVLTPDFDLYLKDVKFLDLYCCKGFFGFSFIGCYNFHYFFVIFFFSCCSEIAPILFVFVLGFFYFVLPQYATLYFIKTIDLLCCLKFVYPLSTKTWSNLPMVGSCVISSPFGSSFSCILFD